MALLLAPYNDAMRLGMGFNSFTQQLCVNDAVQKPNGMKATESDLVPKPPLENGKPAAGMPQHVASDETTTDGHRKTQGGTYVRTHKDGSQADISQIVTWTSTFVNSISEVTEKMDISGSLAIKIDAIGGGAKAQASYLNTEAFKKSDINYHLQVNVINQRLVGENIIEFMPIKNVQSTQFKDVYGDCFISGFLEGGVFNAVISIELEDKNAVKNFGGELSIQSKFAGGAVSVEGEGKGKKESSETKTNDKTTVSVSWSGGGDIITDDVEKRGWTIDTLKAVAISFADKVALCPQRTSAILTKYSSLRSFYEKNLHGSPLDYENAGVYSSALLDAYMDYKSVWKELQAMSWVASKGRAILSKRTAQPELTAIYNSAYQSYIDQDKAYKEENEAARENEQALVQRNAVTTKTVIHKVGKPLPPRKLAPYTPTVFGLDEAQRDCRFEMIKIVREVDAVAEDPQVAVDPLRNNQYLSPILFRQLIPSLEEVDPIAMRQRIQELTKEAEDLTATLKARTEDLELVKKENQTLCTKIESTESLLKAKQEAVAELEALVKALMEERDTLKKSLEAVNTANKDLSSKFEENQKSLGNANSANSSLKAQLDVLTKNNEAIADMIGQVAAKDADIATLRDQVTQKDADIATLRDQATQNDTALANLRDQISQTGETGRAEMSELRQKLDQNLSELSTARQKLVDFEYVANGARESEKKISLLSKPMRNPQKILAGGSDLPSDLSASFDKHASKSATLRLSPLVGNPSTTNGGSTFNDLDTIDESWIPNNVYLWHNGRILTGTSMSYTNGRTIRHGRCEGTRDDTSIGSVMDDGRRNGLIDAHLKAAPESPWGFSVVNWFEMYPISGASARIKPDGRSSGGEHSFYTTAPAPGWTVRGFWGQVGDAFDRLGVVWGKDD